MPNGRIFDYIIVGAGSAGCTLAGRLSEEPGRSVLLIEAGPRDNSIYIDMPAALGVPLGSTRFNWYYHSEPDPHVCNRRIYEARGRVLGGSSSINGLNWVRGNPWDYDNWANQGLKGWSYAECLPYFKRAESFDKGPNIYRGGSGPMKIETSPAEGELFRAFLESGQQAGNDLVDDHNGFRQEGMHVTQRNVHHGTRWSTSRAYLREAAARPNLTVLTNTQITRIEFSNKRAVRVHGQSGAETVSFEVAGELIVASGAINTPQLLLLSGVGNSADLRKLSIPVTVDLPGVGMNLMDHPCAWVQHSVNGNFSLASRLGHIGRLKIAAQWLMFKNGLGASNYFETGAFLRTNEAERIPNLQYEFIPVIGEFQDGSSVALTNGFQYIFALMRPTSRGRVWIDSADPAKPPKFVFNYLSTEQDRREAVAAIKTTREVIAQSAWDRYRGPELTPGTDTQTDADILEHLRRSIGTQYHPCGTCRMGSDPLSVVDTVGRVHETDNLRVVDASIIPAITSGNLNAPVIMMAEKLADELLGRTPLPAEEARYYVA